MPVKLNRKSPTCCDRCGKLVTQLETFDPTGFNETKLVQTFRVLVPYNEDMEAILKQVVYTKPNTLLPYSQPTYNDLWGCLNFRELEATYGRERLHQAYIYDLMADSIVSYYECRDCFVKSVRQFAR